MISQMMIINKILQDKDISIITSNNLDEKYFFNYLAEYRFIKTHFEQNKVVPDKLTFANVFPKFEFIEVSEPNTYLIDQLYRDYNTSFLAECYNDLRKALQSGEVEKAQKIAEKAYLGQQLNKAMTCTNLITDTSRYDNYKERTVDHEKYYMSTGFPEVDQLIGGIDLLNENMLIMARTGVGKTQVLIKLMTAAAKAKLETGMYEGEMTTDKVGYRFDTFLGGIDNKALNRGDIYIDQKYKDYINTLGNRKLGNVKVFTPTDVPGDIVTVNTLRTFIENEGIQVLFVDQYDLLDDEDHGKSEPERVGNIARAIKKLQVEKKIPIISVTQMNRTKNDDGSQDTTQIAGSDKLGRYATIVIALETKYDEVKKQLILTLNIVKARDGGDHNKLTYFVDFNTGVFKYINNDKDGITSDEEFENLESSYDINYNSEENVF